MDYQIFFEQRDLSALRDFVEQEAYSQVFVLVDEHTKRDCLPLLPFTAEVLEVSAGEEYKSLESCQKIWQGLLEQRADRKSLLINLGGGVLGDMGGFAASTYKRGIDFVQVPTTLLAQVDASVGGKLGVDFVGMKNMIGLFANPRGVFVCSEFFATLPKRELRSGFAEVIKHALLDGEEHWKRIRAIEDLEQVDWRLIVEASIGVKQRIVELDPREKGLRKALNFGHSIGHSIEAWSMDRAGARFLHGEAVAAGIICALYISERFCGFDATKRMELTNFILGHYGKLDLEGFDQEALFSRLVQDKKVEGTNLAFTLLSAIGGVEINQNPSRALIWEAVSYYKQL